MEPQSTTAKPEAQRGTPQISVIVPVRNDAARLARCLEALNRSEFRDFEVIVADDGSTDETPSVAEQMGVRVIRLPRQAGAAAARNAAADLARGELLLFVDADVCVHPDALSVVLAAFDRPGVDAAFGSYDLEPAEPNLLSQYKNLAHRFYHQRSGESASTFWTGCGAIRRNVFNEFRFDARQFTRPSIEDIEMGSRMTAAGRRIVVEHRLQATHLKRWTLSGIIRSDLLDRAIPWTRVILNQRQLPGDLNLSTGQRIAALLTALGAAIFFVSCWFRPWLFLAPLVAFGLIDFADRYTRRGPASAIARGTMALVLSALGVVAAWYGGRWSLAIAAPIAAVILINLPFYRFFISHRGWLFTAAALAMHLLYYFYSIAGFAIGMTLHWRDHAGELLEDRRTRIRLYVALATALYLVSWGLVGARAIVRHVPATFIVSDVIGYYVYLPSVISDGDLDFSNQLAVQSLPDDDYYPTALRRNRWPIGVALTLAPAYLAAHALSIPLFKITGADTFAPHGYSVLYSVLCVGWAMFVGLLGLIVADRFLTERLRVPGWTAAAAVLTTWLGTNYAWYFVREPLLTHMVGASWIIFCIYLIHRIEGNASGGTLIWWQLPLLAFTASMALACRMTNAFMLPMFAYLLLVIIRQQLLFKALKLIPLIALAVTPLLLQLLVMKLLMGQVVSDNMQGFGYDPKERFYWTDPALLRILFSSRHGLFFGTPALLLATWGVAWHLLGRGGRRDPLIVCFALGALILWYVNSAWYAWWFGPSVGNRGFVELAVFFTIGFAFAFTWMRNLTQPRRRVLLTLLGLAIVANYCIMAVKLLDVVKENDSLIPWEDRIFTGRLERILSPQGCDLQNRWNKTL